MKINRFKQDINKSDRYKKIFRLMGFLGLLGLTGFIKTPAGSFRYLNFAFFGFFSFFLAPILDQSSDEREVYNYQKARNLGRKFIWLCFLLALLFLRRNSWTNNTLYLDTKTLELLLIYIFSTYHLVCAFSFHYYDRIL